MRYTKKQKGFTLIETLLAMLCLSFISVLFLPIVHNIKNIHNQKNSYENQLYLQVLRLSLAQSYDIKIINNELHYRKNNKTYILTEHKNRLVQRPGYLIYLKDVSNLHFYQIDRFIYMRLDNYEKEIFLVAT